MKNLKKSKRMPLASLLLAGVVVAGFQVPKLMAEANLVEEANDSLTSNKTLQMDNIDIDGKLSASEKLKRQREKLEESNKAMVEKKIEDIRLKNEIALTNRLKEAFAKSTESMNEDKVQLSQAAPMISNSNAADANLLEASLGNISESSNEERRLKIIPYFGATSIKGSNVDFESNINTGATIEAQILNKLTAGVGVGYTALDITDTANSFISSPTTIGSIYYNSFGYGRKISFDRLSLEANSKYFFMNDTLLKPFAGAGISFNRSTLKYEDNGNNYSYNGVVYGNEGFTTNSVAATALIGAELDLSKSVGLNVDLSYTKTLTSGISSSSKDTNTNPDQLRLQNVSKAIEDANVAAVKGGIVVKF